MFLIILHCKSRVFSVNTLAKMYSSRRILHRINKLENRGCEKIENTLSNNRDLKIKLLVE